jgi:hypothetical protein
MEESLYQHFNNELLKDGSNKPVVLAKFYSSAIGVPLTQTIIRICAKLNKMYGTGIVFNAILQIYDMDSVDNKESGSYGLMSYFCKKALIDNNKGNHSLTDTINENIMRIQELEKNKLIIPDPFKEK